MKGPEEIMTECARLRRLIEEGVPEERDMAAIAGHALLWVFGERNDPPSARIAEWTAITKAAYEDVLAELLLRRGGSGRSH